MVNQSLTSERKSSRMLIFQISMPPEMVDEIESIAREKSLVKKKLVSRSSQIRDLCRDSLDRLKSKKQFGISGRTEAINDKQEIESQKTNSILF